MLVESPLAHPSVMMRAAALRGLGGYRAFEGPEDYDLWLRALHAGCRFGKLPEVLLQWRDTPSRLSRTDARYAPERFFELKLESLLRAVPARRTALVVWGAGPIGKAWARGLTARGRAVRAFVEVDPRKIGQTIHGAPVVGVAAAGGVPARGAPGRRGPPRRPRAASARPPRTWGSSASSPWREIFDPHARSPRRGPGRSARVPARLRPPRASSGSARIAALEDRRTLGRRRARALLRDRRSRHPPPRRAGRRAHRKCRRHGRPLLALLADPEVEVRQMTAFALGLIGDRAAVDGLLAALRDPEPVVRARAAEALGQIGDARAAPAVAQLVLAAAPREGAAITVRGDDPGSAADPWLEARLGLFALVRLKDVRGRGDGAARRAGARASTGGRRPGRRCAWRRRASSPSSSPRLRSSDPLSRAWAARGLGALKDPADADALLPLLRDKDEGVVVNALRAVALLGDPRAVPAVAGHVGSASAAIRVEALRALAALPADRGLRERIVGELASDQPAVRAAALLALAKVDREDFALVLSSLDPDPVPAVRAGLAAALAEIGRRAPASAILQGMLQGAGPGRAGRACWRRSARRAAPTPRTPCAATSSIPTSRCARRRSRAWPRSRSPAWARPSRRSTRGR